MNHNTTDDATYSANLRMTRLKLQCTMLCSTRRARKAQAEATVVESTDDFVRHDHRTIHFDFCLEGNAEKTITYTVDYRW